VALALLPKAKERAETRFVNVFQGLVKNALDGSSYTCASRNDCGERTRVLLNASAAEGRAQARSFPLPTFETGVLGLLREIDPHEILNGRSAPDESLALAGQFAAIEKELKEARDFMDAKGFSASIGQRIMDLEAKQKEIGDALAAARQKALHPLSEDWGEVKTLLAALQAATDPVEARLRLQTLLRRIVEQALLLVVARGKDRIAALQIWFAGGKRHRDYIILHRPPKGNARSRKEGGYCCRSLADVAALGPLDLRKPADSRKLESLLAGVNLETLAAAMRDLPGLNAGGADS
jgi:hypothetical protein